MPKDVFFTLLSIWLVWKFFGSMRLYTQEDDIDKEDIDDDDVKEDKNATHIKNKKVKGKDLGGEYADYEEVK